MIKKVLLLSLVAFSLYANTIEEYRKKGIDAYKQGNYLNAEKAFNQAIKIDSTQASIYVHRALLFEVKGDTKRAIADYNRYIQLELRKSEMLHVQEAIHMVKEMGGTPAHSPIIK